MLFAPRAWRAVLAAAGLALASGASSDDVILENAWLRAVPPVAPAMAGYFELRNNGNRSVRLEGAEARSATGAALLETRTGKDGRRRDRALDSVRLDPGDRLRFRPGRRFLQLTGLTDVPRAGDRVEVCLTFSNHDDVCGDFQVRHSTP
ncbi:copper chaperone PCu(A)C [Alloalcanivorax gelatiniphagus]|uniref:Copper chaperone PCu(A)C n=1 Tax=Alloalcanivorax gelatiniphagus TaxID=1194167 RepID=A0ABY2XJQ1_9GAMM|nr:copper chaperone PCu(A)C [Alloalcanivorax gelatiniphagus]TMW12170.1 copper chaperone PCu(A)C [Alloalcanivorax gelatiniphagus]